jgi:hypothetical protein
MVTGWIVMGICLSAVGGYYSIQSVGTIEDRYLFHIATLAGPYLFLLGAVIGAFQISSLRVFITPISCWLWLVVNIAGAAGMGLVSYLVTVDAAVFAGLPDDAGPLFIIFSPFIYGAITATGLSVLLFKAQKT